MKETGFLKLTKIYIEIVIFYLLCVQYVWVHVATACVVIRGSFDESVLTFLGSRGFQVLS